MSKSMEQAKGAKHALLLVAVSCGLISSLGLVGCAGVVSGANNTGNTPPPSSLDITNVQAGPATTSTAQIVWTTNVPADSSVDYGTSTSYGSSTPVDSAMVTSHQVTLSGLAAGTTYYYQVNSSTSSGNHGHSGGHGLKTAGFSISGTISPAAGGSGTTLTLSGATSTTATADSVGSYSFAGLPNGTYTVAPSHAGYAFTPSNQSTTVNGTNITGVNFTANAAAVAPTITTQPANQTVTAGQTATFAVVATGTAPPSYQWQKNGANIAGAIAASYTTPATTTADSGATFAVVVSNTAGTVTSAAATLTVGAAAVAPTITTPPASQTVTAGQTASFTVVATGTVPLSYQWQKSGVSIAGATAASYTTPATTTTDSGATFRVVVSNTTGTVTSPAATLTVSAAAVAPTITTPPASQTVTAGQTATFAVVATGTAPLSYQWQKSGVSIAGATAASYTTPATTTTDSGATFRVVVSNTTGTVTSPAATLTVSAAAVAPTITTPPASQTVTAGQTATFAVVATGTAPLSYQWQKNGANIAGAITASYTTPATTTADSGATFRVVVSNTAGSITSSAATLTVNNSTPDTTPPTVSISAPRNAATVSGVTIVSGTASDNVAVSSVQVSVDNGNFSNASGTNNWTFSLDTASLSNATHTLIAKATDSTGNTATSGSISISVNNASSPTATISWTDVHQQIDGFGAASAFTGTGITDSQADLFWSTSSGVGLSLLRTQIQPDGTYPESATMQKAQARGVRIWGTPWTPPASMKSNGSLTNGGSLLAIDYQAYADYLSQYVLTLKNSYGISLYALSIQNEPNYTATWRSCIWTGQQFHDFILNNLTPTFTRNGVTAKIIMPEESGWIFDLTSTTLNDPAAAAGVSIIAAHNYDGAGASTYPLGQNQGKGLWETEVSTFETFDPSIANGLVWAQKINDWMTVANANAWHYWWLLTGSSNDNEALIGPSGQTTKRLYVMGNFSKFVRPGYVRIGTTASPVGGVSISAYKDPSTGKFAIVAINHNGSNVVLNFKLNGFTASSVTPWVTSSSLNLAQQTSITVGGSAFTATLPASSVTTFVGP